MEQKYGIAGSAQLYLPMACFDNIQYSSFYAESLRASSRMRGAALSPYQALEHFDRIYRWSPMPPAVLLGGQGEILTNFDNVREVLRLLRQTCTEVQLGIETNGLLLPVYATHLISLGVTQVIVKVNTAHPETGAHLIESISYMGNQYSGVEGANILLQNQIAGISFLTSMGISVEIDMLLWEEVNTCEASDVFSLAEECGARMGRIYPAGIQPADFKKESLKYRFAVCTSDGRLINQHFGQATSFSVYDYSEDGIEFIENRSVEKYCQGVETDENDDRIYTLIKTIADCRCVLCTRIGFCPSQVLEEKKMDVYMTYNLIEDGLTEAYSHLYQREETP